jgi:hypothetical protein
MPRRGHFFAQTNLTQGGPNLSTGDTHEPPASSRNSVSTPRHAPVTANSSSPHFASHVIPAGHL